MHSEQVYVLTGKPICGNHVIRMVPLGLSWEQVAPPHKGTRAGGNSDRKSPLERWTICRSVLYILLHTNMIRVMYFSLIFVDKGVSCPPMDYLNGHLEFQTANVRSVTSKWQQWFWQSLRVTIKLYLTLNHKAHVPSRWLKLAIYLFHLFWISILLHFISSLFVIAIIFISRRDSTVFIRSINYYVWEFYNYPHIVSTWELVIAYRYT